MADATWAESCVSPSTNLTSTQRQTPFILPFAVSVALILASLLAVLPLKLAAQEAELPPTPSELAADSVYKNQISGEFTPARGFDVVKTKRTSHNISEYGLARYINQLPAKKFEAKPNHGGQYHTTASTKAYCRNAAFIIRPDVLHGPSAAVQFRQLAVQAPWNGDHHSDRW